MSVGPYAKISIWSRKPPSKLADKACFVLLCFVFPYSPSKDSFVLKKRSTLLLPVRVHNSDEFVQAGTRIEFASVNPSESWLRISVACRFRRLHWIRSMTAHFVYSRKASSANEPLEMSFGRRSACNASALWSSTMGWRMDSNAITE